MIRVFLATIFTLFNIALLSAQTINREPKVSIFFEPDSIGIGDRTSLIIDVEQDMMQMVAFPDMDFNQEQVDKDGNKLPQLLELIEGPLVDTLAKDGRRLRIRQRYRLTSFEAGQYNLGRIGVLYADKNIVDTLYGRDSLRLMVGTFMIDSTSHPIFDLKPLQEMPFKLGEIKSYLTWSIVGLILLLVIAYIVIRVMAHYGHSVFGLFKPTPPLPPHIIAFSELDKLREQRLYQEGDTKGFYSRLTDIMRNYIDGRYGVQAISMTTDEIVEAIRNLEIPRRCEMELQAMLRDADLVKFAKAEYESSTNESYLASAKAFVEETMEVVEEEQAEERSEEQNEEQAPTQPEQDHNSEKQSNTTIEK